MSIAKTKAEAVKAKLRERKPKQTVDWSKGLSTGSTLLNLCMSGRPDVGLLPGLFYLMVGDAAAGKSWIMRTMMAEACYNKAFNDYRIIEDNPENRGSLMSLPRYFGKLAQRVEEPSNHGCSRFLEDFYVNVSEAAKGKKSFIYGLDSEDALAPYDDFIKSMKVMKAKTNKREKEMRGDAAGAEKEGEKIKGDYGMAKAKMNSSSMRLATNAAKDTNSIIIVLKQSRQNVNPLTAHFVDKTRNGGTALTFYNANELWFSIRGKIKRRVNYQQRKVGFIMSVLVKRNSQIGKTDRTVNIPFYDDYGIDDLGSCILFLCDERHWEVKGGDDKDLMQRKVEAPEFKFSGSIEDLAMHVEETNKQVELQLLTMTMWKKIEDGCRLQRKPRYG